MTKSFFSPLFLGISCLAFINAANAYCVYNRTTGNDTIRYNVNGEYNAPTEIRGVGLGEGTKYTDQGDYGCILTSRRERTDVTTVNVYFIFNETYRLGRMICSQNVYNKGGSLVVTGNGKEGFRCHVYRDADV